MIEENFQVAVNGRHITAVRVLPDGQGQKYLFIYAPGAGSNLNDPFGAYLGRRLAGEGIATIRFQFPYMEDGKRRPDSPKLLEETWRQVIQTAGTGHQSLVIGGRSMGGRIASQVVAQGAAVDGLALFAYPLRPPSNPSRVRDTHLADIGVPTFFCSGTRDTFATPGELAIAAAKVPNSSVRMLEGADHGFAVLKSSGRTRTDVWEEAADHLLAWLITV